MVTEKRQISLVIVQLAGGNDALNTIIPYGDGLYYDWRKDVRIEQDKVLPINDYLGFNPALASIKSLYDQNEVAIINGVGYPDPNRSHFRSIEVARATWSKKLSKLSNSFIATKSSFIFSNLFSFSKSFLFFSIAEYPDSSKIVCINFT